MSLTTTNVHSATIWRGMLWGMVGVIGFAGSFPSAKFALRSLDPFFIAFGRAAVAALLAAILLLVTKQPFPKEKRQLKLLAISIAGVVVGFPVLSNLSLLYIPTGYVSVVNGLLPLSTAVIATLFGGERHRFAFWLWAVAGAVLVLVFSVVRASHVAANPNEVLGFALIIFAVVVCSMGYVAGAKLAASVGSWQAICWALVCSVPLLIFPVWHFRPVGVVEPVAWYGFFYQALVSMFLGFFAWYKGLSLGGIARVGQVQLLQPFISLFLVAWLLHESIDVWMWVAAAGVVICVAMGRRA
ncbi:DMT family transporter [Leeia sp. TBRC 13508]|uniref:DMT family transporter n=1 Tax=Leeia speluncae TaxID=2884804 RepID=A0ABS8D7H3_9NEIS|nr:DMT family transporter [Leeia speluncae]MCB6183588.1 DMT family transporter [Leeia speluncae]